MYRLLLVDDEHEIVDWLFDLFQEVPDLELDVYKALSGFEALDILGRTKIDVVISDIKMPGMSGLQLLEKLRSLWPLCRVIFLTGYNEFDYVYTAIKYDGVSYLLKTEEDDEIIKEVHKAIEDLESSTQNKALLDRVAQLMEESRPFLHRSFLEDLLLNPSFAQSATQNSLNELKIPLSRSAPVYLAVGRFDRFPDDAKPAFGVRMAISLNLRAEELLGGSFRYTSMIHQGNIDLIWLLQPLNGLTECDDGASDPALLLGGVLEALQDYSREVLGLATSYVYCSHSFNWEETEENYSALSRLLSASLGMSGELLLNERNFTGLSKKPAAADKNDPMSAGVKRLDMKTMPVLLDRGDGEAFMPLLTGALEYLKSASGRDNKAALELYYNTATMLLTHINRRNLTEKLSIHLDMGLLMHAEAHAGWIHSAEYLLRVANLIFDLQKGVQEKTMRDSVDHVKQYIKDHLCEDLSLVRLAEISYFNPSYLSRLFKQTTGQKLTDYISLLRIDRAKVLLTDYNKKISDISQSLGYESQHYFSRFFKKYMGLTPQEYRESIKRM